MRPNPKPSIRLLLSGLAGLVLLTVGSLCLAWWWPDQTLMHFWLVAQAVPVLYWVLIAFYVRDSEQEDGDDV